MLFKYALNIRRHSVGLSTDFGSHLPEYIVNDIAKKKITQLRSREDPFFLYLHYNGPHSPYFPPLPDMETYTDDLKIPLEQAKDLVHYRHYGAEGRAADMGDRGLDELEPEEYGALRVFYDAKLRYTDKCIGRICDYARRILDEDTVIIVTSDHGELLGEKGWVGHGRNPLEGLVNVPLVVLGDLELNSLSEDILIQHADLAKIILKEFCVENEFSDGIDVRERNRKYAVSQNFDPNILCLRGSKFKYINQENKEVLYELPEETSNQKENFPSVMERFQSESANYSQAPSSIDAELTDSMKSQLRDLGYIE